MVTWIGRFMQRRRLMSRPLADLLVVRRVALPRRSWSLDLTTRAVEGARRDAHMGDDSGSAGAVCTRLDQVRDRPASGDQPPDGAGVPEGTAGAGRSRTWSNLVHTAPALPQSTPM